MRRTPLVASIIASTSLGLLSPARAQPPQTELRIGVVTPRGAPTRAEKSVLNGLRLGTAEAGQTARLFGDVVQMYQADGDGRARGALQAARFLSSERKVQVLVAAAPADADTLARFAEEHGIIFFDVSSRSNSLRASCRRNSFYIAASDGMYSNARRAYAPDNRLSKVRASTADSVVLWNHGLERFGASQLNDRYRAAAGEAMDGDAWAGWVAVKIAAESALRAQSTQPSRLRAYLESPTTQFDGHKGWPLSFRPLDHQLRQPLYMVVGSPPSERTVDIPDLRSISSASSDRAAVDALNRLAGGETRCDAAPRR